MNKTYQQFLKEQSGKTAVYTFGRFNPPTIGHEKLLRVVDTTSSKEGGDYFVYTSHSQDPKKNPLSHKQTINFLKLIFSKHRSHIEDSSAVTALHAASDIYDKGGYTKLMMVVGSDRVRDFSALLNRYNDSKSKHGYYKFDSIEVVSAGERDPDAEGADGMSASKMRQAVKDSDYDVFKMGLPSGTSDSISKNLYNAVAKGMKLEIKEDLGLDNVDELLNPAQLRKLSLRMKLQAKKPGFIKKRQMAMKRPAGKDAIDKRSRKAAIQKVVQKFFPKLQSKDKSELSYSERGQISKLVQKKSAVIGKIAKKLVKDKRKQDVERRKSMAVKKVDDTY
jgi:hypothetical protein|tara:strand:+ start:360 stop:1364 length:1005 start_codon:yes stop_codon:yes gene_type:complete